MDNKNTILGYDRFLMMALLKDGALTLEELDDKTILFYLLSGASSYQKKNNL